MEDIFEKELQKPTVFLDRNVLSPHYIPDTLPHREKEIERIMKILAPALHGKRPKNLFIYGKTGTGKTATTKYVIEKLLNVKEKYNVNVDCVYINCNIINTKYQVVLKCAEYCFPNADFLGFPFSHLFTKMLEYIDSKSTTFVVVLDEIDKVKDLDDLLYALTRANDELKSGHLSIIGITNNITFKKKLDPRSKSTLWEEDLVFPPYNAEQLREILWQRAEKGFKPNTVDGSAINLAAALAAQESGDARYALKLILKAGEIADDRGDKIVRDVHVMEARKDVEEEIVYELIKSLPEHQKIVLYAIALLTLEGGKYAKLSGENDNILFTGEVYEKYVSLAKYFGKNPRSARWCREYINDLEMLGLITTTLSGKGVRGNTTLIKLAFPAEKIKKVIEKHFS